MPETLYIYLVTGQGYYCSLLSSDFVFKKGLFGEAICGVCPDDGSGNADLSPQTFVPNKLFVELMHRIIAREVVRSVKLTQSAQALGFGSLKLADRRASKSDTLVSEDTLGEVDVLNGEIVHDSYRRNFEHRLLSAKGFFHLEEHFEDALKAELLNMPADDQLNYTQKLIRWFK